MAAALWGVCLFVRILQVRADKNTPSRACAHEGRWHKRNDTSLLAAVSPNTEASDLGVDHGFVGHEHAVDALGLNLCALDPPLVHLFQKVLD